MLPFQAARVSDAMPTSPEDLVAIESATRMVAITNAVLAAKNHDALNSACGLVGVAQVLVHDDPVGRTMLARVMRDAINALDPDVLEASLQ